ncbi:MAG: glycosyltransferase family 4 protein [Pseudolabrys sp.]|nr:glycosyltransferase family 4 protein [Pseudolabrys sp.]
MDWRTWPELGLLLIVAAAASALLIAVLRPLLSRYALARPNARSSHTVPTPQGAGIAVIAATVGCSAIAALLLGVGTSNLWITLAAVAAMAALGAVDDIRTIEVAPRLTLQALLVAIVIAALPPDLRVLQSLPWIAERILLLIGGLWFVNLTNFMDGLDWMTVAETVPVLGGLTMLGLAGAIPSQGVIVALALGGAMLGFAPFNRPVASVFLGDVGSLPIGLLLAWLLALLAGSGHFAAALLLPLYYGADATITLIQRASRGERVWVAHRTHFYQRATERGFTVMQIVCRVFAVNVGLAMLALATVQWSTMPVALASLAAGSITVALLLTSFARGRR